ncbi:MAG: threonine/serine dehydratase [Gemmatimonadota bacterium]
MKDALAARTLNEARERIRPDVHRTPLFSSGELGRRIGVPLRLKAENLQKTGSFKVRGALNLLRQMDDDTRARGVVTVSAGNHAQALAWAARSTGTACTVVMPESAPLAKVRASRGYGAHVVLHGTVFDAFQRAHDLARERGFTFVHPFDDDAIIAGQASVGLEILEDLSDIDTIVVPVGGGGLISGVAAAVHRVRPGVRIIGVEPTGAPALRKSLDAGHPVRLDTVSTIADGLGSPMAGDITFRYVQALVEDVVVVTDDEIRAAMGLLLSRAKLLTEPAGAAAVAALLGGRIALRGPAVAVLSGGNVDVERLGTLLLPEE